MKEPIKTKKSTGGRPAIADEQFWDWLGEMRPFLEEGYSIYGSIEKAGLISHKDAIYEKYRDDKTFAEKIDHISGLIGEYANLIAVKSLRKIHTRLVETNGDYKMDSSELQIWKTVAEKHRTAQPFFVSRTEEAEAKDEDFGKVVNSAPTIEYIVPKDKVDEKEKEEVEATENTVATNPETTPSVEVVDGQ